MEYFTFTKESHLLVTYLLVTHHFNTPFSFKLNGFNLFCFKLKSFKRIRLKLFSNILSNNIFFIPLPVVWLL